MKRILLAVAVLLATVPAASAAKPCSVPKAWGQLRNVYAVTWQPVGTVVYMAFEDAAGTVRVLNRNKCEPVPDLEVSRD